MVAPPTASQQPRPGRSGARPQFVVTGFGPFCGVAANPTECLIKWLQARRAGAQGGGAGESVAAPAAPAAASERYHISSLTVLEVSGVAVEDFVAQQQAQLRQQAASAGSAAGPPPTVLLHFGVDTQRPAIHLELQAFNNATFSCPDQAGWQPRGALIEQGPGLGTSSVRTTALPLQQLAAQLRAAGFDATVSRDAGRFICNYTYYRSLQLTSKLQQLDWSAAAASASATDGEASATSARTRAPGPGSSSVSGGAGGGAGVQPGSSSDSSTHGGGGGGERGGWPIFSLFVHVPSFSVVDEQRQREFVLQLMELIAEWLVSGGAPAPTGAAGEAEAEAPAGAAAAGVPAAS